MKNLILISFLFLGIASADGQTTTSNSDPIRIGIKIAGGAVVTRPEISFLGNNSDNYLSMVELSHATPQTSFGLFAQKKFGWLFAEANALYSNYGMVFNVADYSGDKQDLHQMKERFSYVDLQVMGGLNSHGFRISVGPVMHILSGHSSELAVLENYNEKMRKISYGFSGAIGYNLNRFSFDLKYDKAFRTVGDHIYYGYKKSPFLETPDAITFSVGYAIIK